LAGVPERHDEEGAQDPFEHHLGWSPQGCSEQFRRYSLRLSGPSAGVQDGEPLLQSSPSIWPELKAENIQIRDAANYESGKRLAQEFTERHRKDILPRPPASWRIGRPFFRISNWCCAKTWYPLQGPNFTTALSKMIGITYLIPSSTSGS